VSDTSALPLSNEVDAFCAHLAGERRASPNTVLAYRRDLLSLCQFIADKCGPGAGLQDVDRFLLRGWLSTLATTISANSIARKLASVRTFYRFLMRGGQVRENPAAQLATPTVRRKMPAFLGAEQAAEVMVAPLEAATLSQPQRARDAAMLELLYGSGLRVSELCGLDLPGIDFEQSMLRIVGKGRKERLVPLGGKAKHALQAYLALRGSLRHPKSGAQDGRALFLGRNGTRVGVR
jgi:integrase/recombinase XerC